MYRQPKRKTAAQSILTFFLTIFLGVGSLHAQESRADISSFSKIIDNSIAFNKLKDSTAVYSFTIAVALKKIAGKINSNVNINNPLIDAVFLDKTKIAKLDYSEIVSKGYKGVQLKVVVIVLSSDYNSKMIDFYNIPKIIGNITTDPEGYLNLDTIVIQYDKKEYN